MSGGGSHGNRRADGLRWFVPCCSVSDRSVCVDGVRGVNEVQAGRQETGGFRARSLQVFLPRRLRDEAKESNLYSAWHRNSQELVARAGIGSS